MAENLENSAKRRKSGRRGRPGRRSWRLIAGAGTVTPLEAAGRLASFLTLQELRTVRA